MKDALVGTHDVAMPGGVSSDIRLIDGPQGPEVVKRALGKLKVAADWFADSRRSAVEVQALRAARELLGSEAVPEVLWSRPEEHAFAMRPVNARFRNWKQELLTARVDGRTARRVGELLWQLHARSREHPHLAVDFADLTHFHALRVLPFFVHVAAKSATLAPYIGATVTGMIERRSALVHGDYSPKNILADGGDVVILDFEVAHWGDPRFDVAFCLSHLMLKGLREGVDMRLFAGAARAFLEGYGIARAESADAHLVRLIGCLLLARIDGDSPVDYLADLDTRQISKVAAEMIRHPGVEPLRYFGEFGMSR